VLWGRAELLGELEAYKLRPSPSLPVAVRFETGTPSYEGMAGTMGAVEHIASLGEGATRRERTISAMNRMAEHERELGAQFLAGLAKLQRMKLYGPNDVEGRVPTFSFTIDGMPAREAAKRLAARNIFAWSGNFYAQEAITRLGLDASGGLLRVGFCQYSTADEVDVLLEALAEL
jgi:selenocysteine lyase/cysteine desulfurase